MKARYSQSNGLFFFDVQSNNCLSVDVSLKELLFFYCDIAVLPVDFTDFLY